MRIGDYQIPDWLALIGLGYILWEISKEEPEPEVLEPEILEPSLAGQVMTCSAWQTVDTPQGEVIRCMYYDPTCADGKCRQEPAPYPPSILKMLESRPKKARKRKTVAEEEAELDTEIKAVAQMMAKSANDGIEDAKELYKEVLAHGGLRPPRDSSQLEIQDFRYAVPAYLRRKTGTTADDMATEMGYSDGDELLAAIEGEKLRRANMPKGRSYYVIKDFIPDAERYVLSIREAA